MLRFIPSPSRLSRQSATSGIRCGHRPRRQGRQERRRPRGRGEQQLELASLPERAADLDVAAVRPGHRADQRQPQAGAAGRLFLVVQLAVLIWLEMLLARSRYIPALSFVEQPPTYTETYLVQRFQASLSAFSTVWNFMALMAVLFWLLFYAL